MQYKQAKIFIMLNIVYAIDENYNKQAYLSICSILENTSTDCYIFIIHERKNTFEVYKEMIEELFKNVNIKLFNFENQENFYFPNLNNVRIFGCYLDCFLINIFQRRLNNSYILMQMRFVYKIPQRV